MPELIVWTLSALIGVLAFAVFLGVTKLAFESFLSCREQWLRRRARK